MQSKLFRSMSTPPKEREAIRNWADRFPYVNGGLFSGGVEVPRFSKIARSYLLHVGNLDWKKIDPDIFGSMIQAVADDEERGALGMHYTSVPNILKVLNPLFSVDNNGETIAKEAENINAYLVAAPNIIVEKAAKPLADIFSMNFGNKAVDGGNLLLSPDDLDALCLKRATRETYPANL
jgi:hypothetical protein